MAHILKSELDCDSCLMFPRLYQVDIRRKERINTIPATKSTVHSEEKSSPLLFCVN